MTLRAVAEARRPVRKPVRRPARLALELCVLAVLGTLGAFADAAGAGSQPAATTQPATTAPSAPATAPAPTTAAAPAGADVQISDRAYAIARELRCPVCTAESVADSNAEIAGEMRRLIQQQLDAGRSRTQIIDYFRQRYGDWILLDPPKTGIHLLVWVLPVLAALTGLVALVVLVRRWRNAADHTPEADPDDLLRVRSALGAQEDDA